jgi:hypothetical protein
MREVISVSLAGKTQKEIEWLRKRSATLQPNEHLASCPVKQGASIACCWPHAICIPVEMPEGL